MFLVIFWRTSFLILSFLWNNWNHLPVKSKYSGNDLAANNKRCFEGIFVEFLKNIPKRPCEFLSKDFCVYRLLL